MAGWLMYRGGCLPDEKAAGFENIGRELCRASCNHSPGEGWQEVPAAAAFFGLLQRAS